jgi:hypothetical protein
MELTKQEKINIVNEHLKNAVISIYNINMLIIQESAIEPINTDSLSALELRLSNAFLIKKSLQDELTSLNNQVGG